MNGRSIVSRSGARMILASLGALILCVSWAAAQKESATERKNRLADAALAQVPEKAKARKNPLEGDPVAVAAGGKLYELHCADCHGQKAGGTKYGASLLRENVQQATPGALFWILTNGVVRHGMPVWSKLPEPERWQLVTFLESLKLSPASPRQNSAGKADRVQ